MFNRQNGQHTGEEEVFQPLIRRITVDSDYGLWEEYLVDADFEYNGFEDVADLLDHVRGKTRYLTGKRKFLRYANWEYFEYSTEVWALEQFLVQMEVDAPQILLEDHYICAVEAEFQEILSLLANHTGCASLKRSSARPSRS